jgi:hypothetical protein
MYKNGVDLKCHLGPDIDDAGSSVALRRGSNVRKAHSAVPRAAGETGVRARFRFRVYLSKNGQG